MYGLLSGYGVVLDGWTVEPLNCEVEPFPNTDMNDGKVAWSGELVDTGIVDSCASTSGETFVMNECRSGTDFTL